MSTLTWAADQAVGLVKTVLTTTNFALAASQGNRGLKSYPGSCGNLQKACILPCILLCLAHGFLDCPPVCPVESALSVFVFKQRTRAEAV